MKELLLNSQENVGIIAEKEIILGIADDLLEDGVTVYFDEEKEFDDIIEENDILQITKIICEDCQKVTYFIEEVFDEDGYTIPDDELVITYVDSTLFDCIEYSVLDTEIVLIDIEDIDEDYCDCENCNECSCEDEEFDEEAIENIMFDELMSSIEELDIEDDDLVDNIFDLIKDKIAEAFACGYNEGVLDSADESQDTVEAIKSLIIE